MRFALFKSANVTNSDGKMMYSDRESRCNMITVDFSDFKSLYGNATLENLVTPWQVDITDKPPALRAPNVSNVPLKWAHDALTGEPRYIHDRKVVDRLCSCICPACQLSLTPILAGQLLRRDPTAHFRHPPGSQKDDCTIVAARVAATHLLLEYGFIDLPRRVISRTATGFSGQGYEIWVEEPAERRMVRSALLHDHVTAVLTLDNGRKLLADLTGRRDLTSAFDDQALVTISLSDPELAMLSPEEIRSRLRILPDIRWCSHWNDRALATKADAESSQAARDALDDWSADDEADFRSRLTPGIDAEIARNLRRETLLHREVKAILEREKRITTPSLEVVVTRDPPEELEMSWEEDTLRMDWCTAPKILTLRDVQLETRLGRIVPDVIAHLDGPHVDADCHIEMWVSGSFDEGIEDSYAMTWPPTLLVEVTVTHGIDSEKLQRIRELNLATLEIDLSTLGGRVTLEGLRDLVVHQTIGKRWVHHPEFAIQQQRLNAEIDEHPVTRRNQERLVELKRQRWLTMPVAHWADRYLEALAGFHDANAIIKRRQRQHQGDGPKPKLLGRDSDAWALITSETEALSAHGLPGAAHSSMVQEAGLVARILSIQRNTGVGYDLSSGYQVLNAIMLSGKGNKQWDTLYAIAVKAYDLESHFTSDQTLRYKAWRKTLIEKVDANDEAYMRPATFDVVLSALFPEMAERISKGYGRLPDRG